MRARRLPASDRGPAARTLPARAAVPVTLVVVAAVAPRVPLLGGSARDYDEGVYWLSERALAHGDALYGAVFSSQPPAFLPLLRMGAAVTGDSLTALRCTVTAVALLGVAAGAWTAWRLAGGTAAFLAAVLLAADPLLLRASVTLQAEGPALGLALLAVALGVESGAVAGRSKARVLALAAAAGAAACVATEVKLLAVAAVVPAALLAAGVAGAPGGAAAWRGRAAAFAAGVAVTAGVPAVLLRDELRPLVDQVVGFHLGGRGAVLTGLQVDLGAPLARETPLVLLAAAGAGLAWRAHRPAVAVLVAWAAASAAAVAVQRPLFPHHLAAIVPPLALLAALVVAPGHNPIASRVRAGGALLLAGLAAAAVTGYVATLGEGPAGAGPAVIAALRADTPEGALVVTDDQATAAAAGRDTPPELVDTSLVRIASGELRAADVEAVVERDRVGSVLFGTGRLTGLAGFESWVRERFPTRLDLGEGRILYVRRLPP